MGCEIFKIDTLTKYEILRNFTDKYNPTIEYKAGDIVEFTDKRVEEIKSKEQEINEKLIKKVKDKRVVE